MAAQTDRIPPGQQVTRDWPVLHYGEVPRIDLESWRMRIHGKVEEQQLLTFTEVISLPRTEITCDIHCVTRWSRLDNRFEGVRASELIALAKVKPEATHVLIHGAGGFSTNLPLADLMREDVLFAWRWNSQDLTPEHGWPLRLVVPHLYFWKSAKWVTGMEFLTGDRPGFWEKNGYHMYGDFRREQRFHRD